MAQGLHEGHVSVNTGHLSTATNDEIIDCVQGIVEDDRRTSVGETASEVGRNAAFSIMT